MKKIEWEDKYLTEDTSKIKHGKPRLQNVAKELAQQCVKHGKSPSDIVWIDIWITECYSDSIHYVLTPNHTEKELKAFLEASFELNYNNSYGARELDGCVFFTDGSWLERNDYDGLEWWEHKTVPSFENVVIYPYTKIFKK